MKALISEIQEQFIHAVARGRGIPVEKVREVADGRILSGARAKELGLIDYLGNFYDAVDHAKELSGITGDVRLVYPKKNRVRLWDILFQNAAGSLFNAITNSSNTRVEYKWSGFPSSWD